MSPKPGGIRRGPKAPKPGRERNGAFIPRRRKRGGYLIWPIAGRGDSVQCGREVSRIMMRAVAFCTVAFAASLAAQQTVLRTSVREVEVSIVATGAGGAPANLDSGDVRVWDAGKEQTVRSLTKINLGGAPEPAVSPVTAAGASPSGAVPPPSSQPAPKIVSVILLDGLNTNMRRQPSVRSAVIRVLEQIRPDELAAVYALGYKLTVIHDFSSDRASLARVVARYSGQAEGADVEDLDELFQDQPPPDPTVLERRIRTTIGAMETLAVHLKEISGRKNLIWVSAGIAQTVEQGFGKPTVSVAVQGGIAQPVERGGGGPRVSYENEFKHAARVLSDAGVTVYAVDARGLSADPQGYKYSSSRLFRDQGILANLSDSTGGKAYYNRNDLDRGVRQALDDSRGAYLLTFAPSNLKDDGAFHPVRLRTSRKGIQLRYRSGYYAPGPETADAGAAPASSNQRP
jgi:VWFA-related protein